MNTLLAPSAAAAARLVSDVVTEAFLVNPRGVLGVAAGATFALTYQLLASRRNVWGRTVLEHAEIVLLDEYVGVAPTDPASFRHQLLTTLAEPVGIPPGRVHSLNGLALQPGAECGRFEELIARLGGVDIQLLGLGRNGHIGFNEPGSAHESRTRMVELAATTRAANAVAFGGIGAVPRLALTQGVGTILDARTLILLATGADKAPAVAAMVDGPVTVAVPATALRRHPDTTVVLDQAAAAECARSTAECARSTER